MVSERFVILELLFFHLVELVFSVVDGFLLLFLLLLDVILGFKLLVWCLLGVLGDYGFNVRVGRDVKNGLALTVLHLDQRTVAQKQDLTDLEETSFGCDVQWATAIDLLRELDFCTWVLNQQINDLEQTCLTCDFKRSPVIDAWSIWIDPLCV